MRFFLQKTGIQWVYIFSRGSYTHLHFLAKHFKMLVKRFKYTSTPQSDISMTARYRKPWYINGLVLPWVFDISPAVADQKRQKGCISGGQACSLCVTWSSPALCLRWTDGLQKRLLDCARDLRFRSKMFAAPNWTSGTHHVAYLSSTSVTTSTIPDYFWDLWRRVRAKARSVTVAGGQGVFGRWDQNQACNSTFIQQ